MTDRELIELAAKAAGISGWWSGEDFCYGYNGNKNVPVPWRPLTDDGDALRLAVYLDIDLMNATACADGSDGQSVTFPICGDYQAITERHESSEKKLSATRRAIVRAAAEIGKAMP